MHQNPAAKSHTQIMPEFKTYIAIIQSGDYDLFDTVLDCIKLHSGMYEKSRLMSIIPMDTKTVYEVSLTEEEAVVLTLSCPGEYSNHTEATMNQHSEEYVNDRNT